MRGLQRFLRCGIFLSMRKKTGKITIMPGVENVLPWEMHSAMAIIKLGIDVTFKPRHMSSRSADAYLNHTLFEFKSPEGKTIKCVENNLQKALRFQSKNIVIDSCRIKNLSDKSIEHYLVSRMQRKHGIRRIIFVNRSGIAVDINSLI